MVSAVCGDQTLDFIPGFSTIRVADLPEGVVLGNLDSPFSKMLYNIGLMLPQATAVAINSYEEVLLNYHLFQNFKLIESN
jgi:anthocyanidin 3-O-glucosyltransferase